MEPQEFDREEVLERIEARTRLWRNLGFLLLLALWAATAYFLVTLPAIIPSKFDLDGRVIATGSKWTIITLPGFCTLLYSVYLLARRFPRMMNTAVRINENNREIQIKLALRLIAFISVAIELLFGFLLFMMVNGSDAAAVSWLIFAPIAVLFAAIIHYIVQSVQYK